MAESDITIRWVGTNQRVFTLYSSGSTRQKQNQDGVWVESFGEGFYFSPMSVRQHSTARQLGATLGSVKWDARLVDIHGYLSATDNRTIGQVEREWWESWNPDEPGRLWVTSKSGARWLDLRLEREPKVQVKRDPHRLGVLEWDITAIAGWPFWRSESVKKTATGSGLELVNPGDVPAWPRFIASGSLGGDSYTFPAYNGRDTAGRPTFTDVKVKPPTQGFTLDSDPLHEPLVLANGDSGYSYMSSGFFQYPLPPGFYTMHTPIRDSRISFEVDVNWRRPW